MLLLLLKRDDAAAVAEERQAAKWGPNVAVVDFVGDVDFGKSSYPVGLVVAVGSSDLLLTSSGGCSIWWNDGSPPGPGIAEGCWRNMATLAGWTIDVADFGDDGRRRLIGEPGRGIDTVGSHRGIDSDHHRADHTLVCHDHALGAM